MSLGPGIRRLPTDPGLVLALLLFAVAAIVLANLESTPLSGLRQAQFDSFQRLMPRPRNEHPVVVVAIDSQSLAAHGQWPWPRTQLARLYDRIAGERPRAVGFDMVFPEPDRYAPGELKTTLPGLSPRELERLPEPDATFARSLGSAPAVLAVVGLVNPLPGARPPARPLSSLSQGERAAATTPDFVSAIVSRPLLEAAAAGEGLINANPDDRNNGTERGVLRRVPTLAFVDRQPLLSLPLEMIRQALGDDTPAIPEFDSHGMRALKLGDYRLPTQPDGELLLHFGQADAHNYLSADDVLAGRYAPDSFAGRFVIVALVSAGLQDNIVTPLGESVPGVDVHVQVIESLLAGQALERPWWMPQLEMAALLLGGFILLVSVPRLRARHALFPYAIAASVLYAAGYVAFARSGWLFDGLTPALLLAPGFIALLGRTLIRADAERRRVERELQHNREVAARDAGELDAARRIQMGMLPDPQRLFPGETAFAVGALLEPAQAVGGDYYDIFRHDDGRICLCIGDVSGKGVPASLFMAISKTLTNTLTRRHGDLAAAVRDVERELSRENPEFLFVTAFVGLVDIAGGEMEYVCAGHDAPCLLRAGTLSRLPTENAGPPLCTIEDYPYAAARIALQPGDRLCLFTDGVSEAYDGHGVFGHDRLAAALLARQEQDASSAARGLRDEVRRFEAGQAPADDLTLLVFDYRPGPQ